MKIRCDEFDGSVLELIYGEIDAPAAESLREHAAGCPTCQGALESLLATRRLAARLPRIEAPETDSEALLDMARRAAEGFAEREPGPETNVIGARPASLDRGPGLMERLRIALLRPAFATAAAAGLLLAVALVLYQRGAIPAGDSGVESAAPFLGPIGAADLPRPRPAAEPTPSRVPDAVEQVDALPDPTPAQATRVPETTGVGRGGGGAAGRRRSRREAAGPARDGALGGLGSGYGARDLDDATDRLRASPESEAALETPRSPAKEPSFAAAPEPEATAGEDGDAHYRLARDARQRGDCAEAVRHYGALIDGFPNHPRRPDALWEAAVCHRRLGAPAEARRRLVDLTRHPAWRERALDELSAIDQSGD